MIQSPCFHCEDRQMHCHSFCPKYAAFKTKKETERTNRDLDYVARDAQVQRSLRFLAMRRAAQKRGQKCNV